MTELTKQKLDEVYSERNKILAAFAWHINRRRVPLGNPNERAYRALHPIEDKTWESDWRNILVIMCGGTQMTWHYHDSEKHLFEYLPWLNDYKWDGHTTDEKYARLLQCFV